MTKKYLNECPDLNPSVKNLDSPPPLCETECKSNQREKSFKDMNLMEGNYRSGVHANCDPMQTGQIIQDLERDPDRHTIYRYSKSVRGCDEAMLDLFSNIVIIDEQSVAHPVPIFWSSHERAVDFVVNENVRKDTSLVVDRVRLPMMSLYSGGFSLDMSRYTYHENRNYFRDVNGRPTLRIQEGNSMTVLGVSRGIPENVPYTLVIWTLFQTDMNQIIQQIATKFSPISYLRIEGIQWESVVKLDSASSNTDLEPGNAANRVIKYQLGFTVETYIAQPIRRDKAVLKTRIEFTDAVTDAEVAEVIGTLEEAISLEEAMKA